MEPFLTRSDLDELEQQPLEERIEVLAELERTLQTTLDEAASTADPNAQPVTDAAEAAGDEPEA